MTENIYPTDEQLEKIKTWDIRAQGLRELIDYVRFLWWMPERDFRLYQGRSYFFNEPVIKLALHTGGWSGNESIISALGANTMFWILYWRKSQRGGHYWFSFPRDRFKKQVKEE